MCVYICIYIYIYIYIYTHVRREGLGARAGAPSLAGAMGRRTAAVFAIIRAITTIGKYYDYYYYYYC